MTCPSCGGSERIAITPNLFECQSTITEAMVPLNPAAPSGGMRPVYGACGHQYQEGPPPASDAASCSCGMYAVGRCGECKSAVCGNHGHLAANGVFTCGRCSQAKHAKHAAAEAERKSREYAATPRATPDLLLAIINGSKRVPALRWDVEVSGEQCAGLLRQIKEPSNYRTGGTELVRKGLKRIQTYKSEPGWLLYSSGSVNYDMVETFVMADGRQMLYSDFVEHSRGVSHRTSFKEPHELVDPKVLRMGITFTMFREKFLTVR